MKQFEISLLLSVKNELGFTLQIIDSYTHLTLERKRLGAKSIT